jgi:hypothetical protein
MQAFSNQQCAVKPRREGFAERSAWAGSHHSSDEALPRSAPQSLPGGVAASRDLLEQSRFSQ